MYAIEKNVTPPISDAINSNSYYGFERLKPGDSFLVPSEGPDRKKAAQRVRWAIKSHRKKTGTRWRTKTLAKGIRVWRIE